MSATIIPFPRQAKPVPQEGAEDARRQSLCDLAVLAAAIMERARIGRVRMSKSQAIAAARRAVEADVPPAGTPLLEWMVARITHQIEKQATECEGVGNE